MKHFATRLVLLFGFAVLSGLPGFAQNKAACELLSKADAEAVLGVTMQPPKPTEPFRSLLDPALYPVLAALPDNPRSSAQIRNPDNSGFGQSILDGLVAAAVIVIALDVLLPKPAPESVSSGYPGGMDPVAQTKPFVDLANHQACVFHVQAQLAGGFDSGETCGW